MVYTIEDLHQLVSRCDPPPIQSARLWRAIYVSMAMLPINDTKASSSCNLSNFQWIISVNFFKTQMGYAMNSNHT